jgi:hypothetical protein
VKRHGEKLGPLVITPQTSPNSRRPCSSDNTLQPARNPHTNHGIFPGFQCTQIFRGKPPNLKHISQLPPTGLAQRVLAQLLTHFPPTFYQQHQGTTYLPTQLLHITRIHLCMSALPLNPLNLSASNHLCHHLVMKTSSRKWKVISLRNLTLLIWNRYVQGIITKFEAAYPPK